MGRLFAYGLHLGSVKKHAEAIRDFFTDEQMPDDYKFHVIENSKDRAEKIFKRMVAIYPKDRRIHELYATILIVLGKKRTLREEYERAMRLIPEHADVLNNYAVQLQDEIGGGERAEELYLRAIELEPDNPVIKCNYGNMLAENRRYEEALVQFRKAHALMPEDKQLMNDIRTAERELAKRLSSSKAKPARKGERPGKKEKRTEG